jgi:hypothetical protein
MVRSHHRYKEDEQQFIWGLFRLAKIPKFTKVTNAKLREAIDLVCKMVIPSALLMEQLSSTISSREAAAAWFRESESKAIEAIESHEYWIYVPQHAL